jgi:hypothetical protein
VDEQTWLVEEQTPPSLTDLVEAERMSDDRDYDLRGGSHQPTLAITMHDIVVHDVHKWFGGADIRLDALVVHGATKTETTRFYHPGTFRFAGVRDGQRLAIDTGGLLIFYGRPRHFLDIFITIARDRTDSDDLMTLLRKEITAPEGGEAIAGIASLTGATALSAAIPTALAGAATLGGLAYHLVRKASGTSLGLYRASWLQVRDGFGIGRHPEHGAFRPAQGDVSFRYEIALEEQGT